MNKEERVKNLKEEIEEKLTEKINQKGKKKVLINIYKHSIIKKLCSIMQ